METFERIVGFLDGIVWGTGFRFGGELLPGHRVDAIDDVAGTHAAGRWRVRLLVDRMGTPSIASTPYQPEPRPWRIALAGSPIDDRDPFILHKTTNRLVHEKARAARHDVDDVVLWNRRSEITEVTIANVVVELDGVRVTPPVASGLLAGTFRGELLDAGVQLYEYRPSMTHVKALMVDGIWAVVGTTTLLGRSRMVSTTSTNWPGQSRRSVFSNSPLSCTVPVVGSTMLSMNASTACAMSRGARWAGLASRIASVDAHSPWSACFGRSNPGSASGSPATWSAARMRVPRSFRTGSMVSGRTSELPCGWWTRMPGATARQRTPSPGPDPRPRHPVGRGVRRTRLRRSS